jgi:putative hydrolase of the HAD superfamily
VATLRSVELVVFDLDDTLLDHRGSAERGLATWLPSLDIPPGSAITTAWFDAEERHFARWRAGELAFAEQRRARLREILPAAVLPARDEDVDLLFAEYVVHYEAAWQLFPDALPCLQRLRATGMPVAVLTNGLGDQQNRKVVATGLADLAGTVFTAEGIGAAKPHREAFAAVTAALAVDPARTLYVGDSYAVDYVGARAAGWQAILLDRCGTAPLAAATIASLADLHDRLGDCAPR